MLCSRVKFSIPCSPEYPVLILYLPNTSDPKRELVWVETSVFWPSKSVLTYTQYLNNGKDQKPIYFPLISNITWYRVLYVIFQRSNTNRFLWEDFIILGQFKLEAFCLYIHRSLKCSWSRNWKSMFKTSLEIFKNCNYSCIQCLKNLISLSIFMSKYN